MTGDSRTLVFAHWQQIQLIHRLLRPQSMTIKY
jgi:hypothetical protein